MNIVTGDGPTAGAALVDDPRVDKIAFTGGVDAGRLVIKSAADTVKRMSIELGGKNPNIVFADADFEEAVDGALFGAFANQGEVCSAGSRLLVERSIYDRMLDALSEKCARDPAWRSAGSRDEDGAAGHPRAPGEGAGLHRGREARGPAAGRRRHAERSGAGPWLLRRAHNLRRRGQQGAHRAGGDLRSGPCRHSVRRRGRRDAAGERHAVRAGRGGMDA